MQMDEQSLKVIIGKNIKYFRFHRQLSQADLATKAHISITFLSNIERGNNFPKAGTLCNLAKSLEIGVWELFKGEEDTEENNIIDRFSADVKTNVDRVMEEVFRQYRG
jgi:transcriptional regulator with XRE-family HTH domain